MHICVFLYVCMCMCVCLPSKFFLLPHANLSPHLCRVAKNSLLNVSNAASMIVSEQDILQADIDRFNRYRDSVRPEISDEGCMLNEVGCVS